MKDHRVRPGTRVDLSRIDADDTDGFDEDNARARLARDLERLAKLQDVFYAEHRRALLVVLQGMDTAGKDGTIKHVMNGVNPSGCEVTAFKVPTAEEAEHDFLWRAHRAAPRSGHIVIFNRSHYEDVIVTRVHHAVPRKVIKQRYDHINGFERMLADNDTVVLKFFLHISKREQARRLRERLDDPAKQWKFSVNDLAERKRWPHYMAAYEKALSHCNARWAPWYVIPSNHKWYRNLAVASVLVDTLERLHCRYPQPQLSPAQLRRLRREIR